MGDEYASFTDDPRNYLTGLAQFPPSREAVARLAGSVASSMKEERNAQIAAMYLQAAARHLPATTASATAPGGNGGPLKGAGGKADVEMEMRNTQQVYEVVEAVGHAVTMCQPRSLISQSGILPVLRELFPIYNNNDNTTLSAGPVLSVAHVEFLQACIYAGHYAYAERMVQGNWPRPNGTISVRNVLRYFYLRGVVHLGCQHLPQAVRCFRTCLTIPSECVSAIAVAAWKKLVLIQCLLQSHLPVDQTTVKSLPGPTPNCLSRFINGSVSDSKSAPASGPVASAVAAAAPEDATSIVHLVDSLETGDSDTRGDDRSQKFPSMGVAAYLTLVKSFVEMNQAAFAVNLQEATRLLTADGNMGLARQVESELPCRLLYSWSRVYSSISLMDLAELVSVSVEELQHLLVRVTIEKEWPIQVSTDGQMVLFPPMEPVILDGSGASEDLLTLAKLVQKLDATLSTSNKFMSLSRKESSGQQSEGSKSAPSAASGPRGVEDI